MAVERYTAELIALTTAANAAVDQLERMVGRASWLDNALLLASIEACDEDERAGEVVYKQIGGGLMDDLLCRIDNLRDRIDTPTS